MELKLKSQQFQKQSLSICSKYFCLGVACNLIQQNKLDEAVAKLKMHDKDEAIQNYCMLCIWAT